MKQALPLVLLGLLVQGCGTRLPYLQKRTELPQGSVCRVAVLPFVNESDYHLGQEIAYKVFAAEFTRLGSYLSASEGDIAKIYRQMGLYAGQVPSTEQLGVLGNRLGARLLVTGKVLEMRENPGEHGTTNPVLALDIRIHDGTTGDVLWTTYHRRQGTDYRKVMHFGKIHTVTGLGQQVAAEIVNLWFEQGLTACDAPPRL